MKTNPNSLSIDFQQAFLLMLCRLLVKSGALQKVELISSLSEIVSSMKTSGASKPEYDAASHLLSECQRLIIQRRVGKT